MFALDPPATVARISRFLNIDAKAVRDSERIGLRRLAEARLKAGNLSPAPQPPVHRLRKIGEITSELEVEFGDLEKFWDERRGCWRWRSDEGGHYSGDRIDPERFLRQDGGYVPIARPPILVPIATLLTRER
jgi:hypothetical protein